VTASAESIHREVRINAAPATVFAYFTDAEKIVRWMGIAAELEPVPGGAFRVDLTGLTSIRGTFLEVVPSTRLVFSWQWVGGDHPVLSASSTVEITLIPDGEGTLVRVAHRNLAADRAGRQGEGWDHYLARLAMVVVGCDPGADYFGR
jgi:uncharacterized protein YndB with AHSA1/START domain